LQNQSYTIQLNNPTNIPVKYHFPIATELGSNLRVEGLGDLKKYTITKSKTDTATKYLRLLVHKNQEVILSQLIFFKRGTTAEGSIETSQLHTGILHFTLLDSNNLPLAERLVFVQHNDYTAPATINFTKTNLGKRQLNEWELSFKEKVQVSASIAITDANVSVDTANQETIYSRLLLTEDIKGEVYNPAWYFKDTTDATKEALDVLLMTHGWKHFSWQSILNNRFFKEPPKDNAFITLTGAVFTEKNNTPITKGSLSLLLTLNNKETIYETAAVQSDGSFMLDSLVTWGTTKMLFSYINADGKAEKAIVKIKLDSLNYWVNTNDVFILQDNAKNFATQRALSSFSFSTIDFIYKEAAWGNGKVYVQEAVTVKGRKIKQTPASVIDAKYATGAFNSGQPRRMYDLVNRPHPFPGLSVWDYIGTYLPVDLENGGDGLRIVSRTQFDLATGKKWSVAIFLNENEINDGSAMNVLKTTIIEDVALIKYWATSFMGAVGNAPAGAIAIYLKKHEDRQLKTSSPVNTYTFDGYSVLEEFYSPDYSKPDKRHSSIDTRTTLYWNPDIITNSQNNKINISFYNNDFTKAFKVVLVGFDQNGRLIQQEKVIYKED
jgi:hypothetical protein